MSPESSPVQVDCRIHIFLSLSIHASTRRPTGLPDNSRSPGQQGYLSVSEGARAR